MRRPVVALLLRTALLLGGGAAVGFGLNAVRSDGVHPGTFAVATSCAAPVQPIDVVEPRHAAHLCGAADVLVADVRSADAFARGHVAGAMHLPCAASRDVLGRALAAAAGKHTLVVYGDTTDEARAVAGSLRSALPRPDLAIKVLAGGFPSWSAEGLACSSGPCPDCGMQARDREGR